MTERTSRDAATELETQDEAVAHVMVDEFQRALMAVLAPGSPAEYADSCGRFEHVRGVLIAALAAASTPAPRGLGDAAERGPEGGEEMSPVGHALLLMQEAEERGSATLTAAECADMLEYLIAINDATPEAEREDASHPQGDEVAKERDRADENFRIGMRYHRKLDEATAANERLRDEVGALRAALRRAAPGAAQQREALPVDRVRLATMLTECDACWTQERANIASALLARATPAPTGERAGGAEDVYDAIRRERAEQDEQWGGPAHDDAHQHYEWQRYRHKFENAAANAITAGPKFLAVARTDLVKIAALAVAEIESLDRRVARFKAAGLIPPPVAAPRGTRTNDNTEG